MDARALTGLYFRPLAETDIDRVMALQSEVQAALPEREWYFPSPREMFLDEICRGEGFGYFDGDTLAGFAVLTPWHVRGASCYAAKAGQPTADTYDFQDVMVALPYRRRGVHSALLDYFERAARDLGGKALYCTISPKNTPSLRSFEKAGYRCVVTQPAYEGWLRCYYRREL